MEPPGGRSRSGSGAAALFLAFAAVAALAPTREGVGAPYRAALERVLTEGPGLGRWWVEDAWGVRVRALAGDPSDPARVLVGRVEAPPGEPEPDWLRLEAKGIRSFPRARLASYAGEAPAALFFRNYVASGPPVSEALADGTPALRVRWRPRRDLGGETGRTVWHAAATGEVLRLEDRSFQGRVLRRLERLASDPGPRARAEAPGPPDTGPGPGGRGRGWRPRPPTAAPFPVFGAGYLPPGFERLHAGYFEWPRSGAGGRAGGGAGARTRVATTVYSDGLASLVVSVAPAADLDALEAMAARWEEHRAGPDGCPTLPEPSGDLAEDGLVIRRRADLCRTVLRVDDLDGVSVAVVGRNEVPGDEYVKVIRGLVRLQPTTP